MKKSLYITVFLLTVSLLATSCGSRKNAGRCDAYGSIVETKGDLARK
jgi:hypothetical protein